YGQGKVDDGTRWAGIAKAQVKRVDDPVLRAALANALGNLADAAGDFETARVQFAAAAQAWRAAPGDHGVELGGALQNEGNALRELGKLVDALAKLDEASRIWTALLGPEHPYMGMLANNTAIALH